MLAAVEPQFKEPPYLDTVGRPLPAIARSILTARPVPIGVVDEGCKSAIERIPVARVAPKDAARARKQLRSDAAFWWIVLALGVVGASIAFYVQQQEEASKNAPAPQQAPAPSSSTAP